MNNGNFQNPILQNRRRSGRILGFLLHARPQLSLDHRFLRRMGLVEPFQGFHHGTAHRHFDELPPRNWTF